MYRKYFYLYYYTVTALHYRKECIHSIQYSIKLLVSRKCAISRPVTKYFNAFSLALWLSAKVANFKIHNLFCNVCILTVSRVIICFQRSELLFLAHLSRRLTRWAYRMGLQPASVRLLVRACVHTFKHEYLRNQQADYNQILSEASLGWGKGCIRFWCRSDQIRTLVSMATDSSHRVIMGKRATSRFLGCF